ncbi:phage capsid family protein [Methylobacterium sp. Gmos1]
MAVTTSTANSRGVIFTTDIIREMVRQNMFKPYMGNTKNAIIRTINQTAKTGGDQINIPLVTALNAPGVGNGLLSGNEEALQNYGYRMWLDWARNAVKISKSELKKMSVDIYDYAGPMLQEWAAKLQRDEMVQAWLSIPTEATPPGYGSGAGRRINGKTFLEATTAELNTWTTSNIDRIQFGIANTGTNGNYVAGDFNASLANIDATNDRWSTTMIDKLKAKGKKPAAGSPKVTPLTMDDGYEGYVLFVGTNGFMDLKNDPKIVAMNKDARPREGRYRDNPLFNDGDLLYDKVIIREVPEFDTLGSFLGRGASGINVTPGVLAGQCAMTMVMGQLPRETHLTDDDYQFFDGRGVDMAYGLGKTAFKTSAGLLKDWGAVTGFAASVDPT